MPQSSSMSEAFETFHDENPRVYSVLVRLAREWVSKFGRHDLGIGMLYEVARWEITMSTSDPEYKLNNNFRAFYARLMMYQERDLRGLFEMRASEADEWIFEFMHRRRVNSEPVDDDDPTSL